MKTQSTTQSRKFEELSFAINSSEVFWVNLQPFLLHRGYQLRRRYDPNWKPSWLEVKAEPGQQNQSPTDFEDSVGAGGDMLDAIRLEDNKKVVFKKVNTEGEELPIALFLSSDKMKTDPRNCAVPILDVILIPGDDDHALIVMPHLLPFDALPFRFLGEFCEMALQLLEGLEAMHEQNIIHRDACWGNFMMDHSKVVPKGTHFGKWSTHDGVTRGLEWNTRWSVRPVQYHIIDFGLSMRCPSKAVKVLGEMSQDRDVPELSSTVPYDPFPVDIFQLGNVFNRCIQEYDGLTAFTQIAEHMTKKDPKMRPTATEAVHSCKDLVARLERCREMKTRVWRLDTRYTVGISRFDKLAVRFGQNPMY